MGYGNGSRGPIEKVSSLQRVENADVISRVRAAERVSRAATIDGRMSPPRSFAEALERNGRGLVSSEPLPEPHRPLPPPARQRDETLELPERQPESFLGLLWWKVQGRI